MKRAEERSQKEELTSLDIIEARNFIKINNKYLSGEHGQSLKLMVRGQIDYANHMKKLSRQLTKSTSKLSSEDSTPSMERLFVNANQICKDNPKFKDSLIVSLLHAAVAKHMYGSNAASEEKVVNFYRYIHTYNPKVAQVVSANLHGPSER